MQNIEIYQTAFIKFYESILSLSIKSLIKDKEILDEIKEYHNLYFETRKYLTIKNLSKELNNPEIKKSISESLDELKNGDYVYFKDFKKEF